MQSLKVILFKLFAVLITSGFVLTLASALYNYEFHHHYSIRDYMSPWPILVFDIPQKQISYGWPMLWITCVEVIRQTRYGSVRGRFSNYSIIWQGFLVDVLLYGSFFLSLLILRDKLGIDRRVRYRQYD